MKAIWARSFLVACFVLWLIPCSSVGAKGQTPPRMISQLLLTAFMELQLSAESRPGRGKDQLPWWLEEPP